MLILLGVIAAWVIWEKWLTPQESKEIRWASRKKIPLSFLAGDDGYGDFEPLPILGRQGYAATSKQREKKWIGFFASSAEEVEEEDKSKKIGGLINKLAARKLYLRHAKIPIWFSYSGKAILTSLYALIGLELAKAIGDANPNPNPKVVVDLTAIKSLFPNAWDESQLEAQESDAEMTGVMMGRKFFSEGWNRMIFGVSIVLVLTIGVIVLAAIFFK